MTRDTDISNIIDTVDSIVDLYEENKDVVEDLVDPGNTVKLGSNSPLKSATMDEDTVYITVESVDGGMESIDVKQYDDGIMVGINGEVVKVDGPTDVDTSEASASLNNGVLEVEVPRTGGE